MKPEPDDTPSEMYAACSFSYLAAMIASNHALQFIPYPTQVPSFSGSAPERRPKEDSIEVLGKSCKPIPVMLMGVLFARRSYPTLKYFFVLLIVIGVALFLYKDGKDAGGSVFRLGWGELLLAVSLLMDGTTGTIQASPSLLFPALFLPLLTVPSCSRRRSAPTTTPRRIR